MAQAVCSARKYNLYELHISITGHEPTTDISFTNLVFVLYIGSTLAKVFPTCQPRQGYPMHPAEMQGEEVFFALSKKKANPISYQN